MTSNMNDMLSNAVKGAVLASLAPIKDDLLTKLVENILNKEVNHNGLNPSYNDQRLKYIDYLFNDIVANEIRNAVREFAEENKVFIKDRIKQRLNEQDGVIEKLSTALSETLTYQWQVNISVGSQ